MDVEDPALPACDEFGRQQPHIAGERDQLDAVLAQLRVEQPRRIRARSMPLWLCAQVAMPSRLASDQAARLGHVRGDEDDLVGAVRSRRLCSDSASMFEPRPEIRTRDPDPLSHDGSRSSRRAPLQVPAEPRDGAAAFARLDPADREDGFARVFKRLRDVLHIVRRDDQRPCRCRS